MCSALSAAVETKNEQQIIELLKGVDQQQDENVQLINNDVILKLINFNNDQIKQLSVKAVAELCKNVSYRTQCTNPDIIKSLFSLTHHKNSEVSVNAIRALGNICFDNDEASKLVSEDQLESTLNLLKSNVETGNSSYLTKICGFFLNLLTTNESLLKHALKNGVVDIFERILTVYKDKVAEQGELVNFVLTMISLLVDYFDEISVMFTESLCKCIVDVFKISDSTEVRVNCLEIFHSQSEKEEILSMLAQEGICELLCDLIEKYRSQINDEGSRSVLKEACDLIVIILTRDDSMILLYDNGQGKVYHNMVSWLDSDDSDLLCAGILAIGNFARKDQHCIQMVEKGILKKLIKLLSQYNSVDSDFKIQHALLSTVRNLVIPQQNKALVLKEGILEIMYKMINIDQVLVVFKLLGTFRMIVDGQESAAFKLISRKEFIEKLVHWCYNSDHLGVRGEVPRLLCWLIKNCHSFKPFINLIEVKDSIKCIIEMISSNHAVMQNEALHALHLVCVGCRMNFDSTQNGTSEIDDDFNTEPAKQFFNIIVDAEIGKILNFVINKYGDKMEKPTVENLMVFLEEITKSNQVRQHLVCSKTEEALKKFSNTEKISRLIAILSI